MFQQPHSLLFVISETALGAGSGSIHGGPRFVVAACDCRADARKRVPPKKRLRIAAYNSTPHPSKKIVVLICGTEPFGGPRFVVAACDCRADARKRGSASLQKQVKDCNVQEYASFFMMSCKQVSETARAFHPAIFEQLAK